MWHFVDKDFEVHGTRQQLKEQLNINVVYFEDRDEEELFDPYQPSHWAIIVREYNLVGNDD